MGWQDVIVTPSEWLPRGEAVAYHEGRPLVIWQGIPGEKAEVHVFHQGDNRSFGRWIRAVDGPNPHRVTPRCERYGPCGGCPVMHLDAEGQVRMGLELLRTAMEDEQVLDAGSRNRVLKEMTGSPDGNGDFRHVMKLAVGFSDRGHVRLGAFGRNSRDIVTIPDCNVVTPGLRRAMRVIAYLIITLEVRPFVVDTHQGVLRYVVVRQSRTHKNILVTLVAARRHEVLGELAQGIAEQLSEVEGVHLHINDGPGNAIFQADGTGFVGVQPLTGRMWLEENVADVRIRIGPGDFYQTNPAVADLLYRRVVSHVLPARPLVDLYCGVGGMTLAATERAGFAIGVENLDAAVARARESAALNHRPAEFLAAPVVEALPEIGRRLGDVRPTVLVNPARRGLEDGVPEGIQALKPARILYVSCNPRSLARDLRIFMGRGYRLQALAPFNMFPNTSHIETLAVLDPEVPVGDGAVRGPRRRRVTTS